MLAVSSPEQSSPPLRLSKLKQGQHVLIPGQNGSGKTTLLRQLSEVRPSVIVLDTKHENNWPGWVITSNEREAFGDQLGHVILRPKSLMAMEYVFRRAYDEHGWTIGVDEAYSISATPGSSSILSYPPGFTQILTRGRSRSVTLVACTQRPRFLPNFALTEPYHFFIFELGSPEDLMHLVKFAGIPRAVMDADFTDHHFVYYYKDPSGKRRQLVRSRLELAA